MTNTRGKLTTLLLVAQVIFMIFAGLFGEYDASTGPSANKTSIAKQNGQSEFELYYRMYLDVNVMVFVGLGFLLVFLQRHGFGSVGFTFLLACFLMEWSIFVNGWFGFITNGVTKIYFNIKTFLEADFALVTVLISIGAVLGKVSPIQMLILSFVEVGFYNLNYWIGVKILKAMDIGGSMFIHAFGAYFGLAVARVLYNKTQVDSAKESSSYISNLFAMIGTLFLWIYWPSFNGSAVVGNERHRAVVNTLLSLATSTVTTFAISATVNKRNKLDMIHVQNATLAGGVAMGAGANLIMYPLGAMLTGIGAGFISVIGFRYIQPVLTRFVNVHDTCGIHNLHGMPGILGAVVSAISCAIATKQHYNESYEVLFTTRDAWDQAGYQMLALGITIALAIVGGACTGLILKIPFLDNLTRDECYEDSVFWEIGGDGNATDSGRVDQAESGYADELTPLTAGTQ